MARTLEPFLTLALDQGGHSSRALVFDLQGRILAASRVNVAETRLADDRVEQDAEELVASLLQAAGEVLETLGAEAEKISAAGLATQRSSVACWDLETGEALSPVLSWQDRRAARWLERFSVDAEDIHERTGLFLSPHYGASKLRWCLDNLDQVQSAQQEGRLAWGPLAGFLIFRLVEESPMKVDPANAARTLLLDLQSLDWDAELIARFGLQGGRLPACVSTLHDYGTLEGMAGRRPSTRAAGGPRCQLEIDPPGGRVIPLRAVNGDQSAALFASGKPGPSTLYLNVGTGAFLQRIGSGPPCPHPRLLESVVLAEGSEKNRKITWVLEGTVNGAASALDWLARELGLRDLEARLPGWLERVGRAGPRDATGRSSVVADETRAGGVELPLFLNGISGLGSPFWVPDLPSRFVGHGNHSWEPWMQAIAVLESIAFLIQANLEEMQQLDPPLDRMRVSGGLAHLDGLCQLLADLSGLQVARPAMVEATARGIAWLAAGRPSNWSEPGEVSTFLPRHDPALIERYRAWRCLMPEPRGQAR